VGLQRSNCNRNTQQAAQQQQEYQPTEQDRQAHLKATSPFKPWLLVGFPFVINNGL
jgi:hypothetical protein